MTNTQKARKYCKQHAVALPKAWKGYKLIWHPWHQPASRLLRPMTFQEYVDRLVEIAERKPQDERRERFYLMKPCKYVFRSKAHEALSKAHEALSKADEALSKADEVWSKAYKARLKAHEALSKADEAWPKADAKEIAAAHMAECPNCKWDGNCLPQFN